MAENKAEKKKKKKTAKEPKEPPIVSLGPRVDPLIAYEERKRQEEEEDRKRIKDRMESKIREEEMKVDRLRLQIRKKCKSMVFERPPPYKPQEPIKKSAKLVEYENLLSKGTFFDDDSTRQILENVRNSSRKFKLMHKLAAYEVEVGSGRLF